METLDRRSFLRRGAAAAGGGLAMAGPMQALVARAALAQGEADPDSQANHPHPGSGPGYGRLVPVPEEDTGEVMLHLPRGFRYRAFGMEGAPLSDGATTPGSHDGMASFRYGRGRVRLVRNHELLPLGAEEAPDQEAFGRNDSGDWVQSPYDEQGPGGTTTLEVSPYGKVMSSWVSLNGTTMNCAGGPMPWGSWVSCEENISGPDVNVNFLGQTLDLTRRHGYIYEVPSKRGPWDPATSGPIIHAGRFNHEAVAWGRDGSLYLTEDNFDGPSGFYRYVPPKGNRPWHDGYLADGGQLYMLVVHDDGQDVPFEMPDASLIEEITIPIPGTIDTPSADLRGEVGDGTRFRTSWVPITDPDPDLAEGTSNTWGSRAVVLQGWLQGGARFSRIEGCWFGDNKIFFNATSGGAPPDPADDPFRRGTGLGQVWEYDIRRKTLRLLFEPTDADQLNAPDNITISPKGSLLLCEDSSSSNQQRLIGLTRSGRPFEFARNNLSEAAPWAGGEFGDGSGAEWAGANFMHNPRTLFVNIQASPAVSFAIWGPWDRGAL